MSDRKNGPQLVTPLHGPICAAINNRHQISFMYQGKLRIAEPHDYGIQNERERLLTYQVGGRSSSGRLPDWRWFDVAKISDFEVLQQTFPGNRVAPSGNHRQWDVLFARVAEPESENQAENSRGESQIGKV
jgi:hypothetical protein